MQSPSRQEEKHMCKYYFGYHYYNGQFWPMMWYTENGITMGGHPEIVPGTLKEIRECEFLLRNPL